MIRDIIERFSYRFDLWRRQRREDSLWGGSWPELSTGLRDRTSYYSDPKRAELLRESTLKSIGRVAGAYFGIIIIASQIGLFIGRSFPPARSAVAVVFLVFAGLWTLVMIVGEVDLRKARKQYRQQQAKLSNQSLQLTADRTHRFRVTPSTLTTDPRRGLLSGGRD